MFESIFNLVNKLFEIDNEKIFFNNSVPDNIVPILLSINKDYKLDKKCHIEIISNLRFYIIKSNYMANKVFIDQNGYLVKSIIISIDENFLEKPLKDVISIIESIYEFIFKEIAKSYSIKFNISLMKKIFTMYTIKKYIGDLKLSDFNLDGIISQDLMNHILMDYDIQKLYDENYIYLIYDKL